MSPKMKIIIATLTVALLCATAHADDDNRLGSPTIAEAKDLLPPKGLALSIDASWIGVKGTF